MLPFPLSLLVECNAGRSASALSLSLSLSLSASLPRESPLSPSPFLIACFFMQVYNRREVPLLSNKSNRVPHFSTQGKFILLLIEMSSGASPPLSPFCSLMSWHAALLNRSCFYARRLFVTAAENFFIARNAAGSVVNVDQARDARRRWQEERGGLTYSAKAPNKCSDAAIERERMCSDFKERFALGPELQSRVKSNRGGVEKNSPTFGDLRISTRNDIAVPLTF